MPNKEAEESNKNEDNSSHHLPPSVSNTGVSAEKSRSDTASGEGSSSHFYKITKSDSQCSIEQLSGEQPLEDGIPKPTREQTTRKSKLVNNRCANRRAEAVCPKNSFGLDGGPKHADAMQTACAALFGEQSVRPRGEIPKKKDAQIVNLAENPAIQNGINMIGWQATCQTMGDRMAHMLMNETLADVFFLFRQSNGILQKIPAHKFVLSIGSAVFEAMFRFGDNNEGNDVQEIELVDVEREAFEALLTFLYIDSSQAINKDSVMSILYTAKKYAVPALENACINFLETCLNSENAFMLLAKARFYDEERLARQCLEIIDEEAHEALKSEDFLNIDHETLCIVLRRNTLRVKELSLFNSARRWAQENCRQKNLPLTPENQRNLLGDALYLIRFPLINPTDFAKHIAPTKLLSDAEMVSVFLFYHNGPEQPLPFSLSYRGLYTPEMVVNRFQRVESTWGYTNTPDRVKFMVDTPILVLGFGLYGSYNRDSSQYSVTIEILNFSTDKTIASNKCQFISDGSPLTFRVMFDEPVEVSPNTTYIASANLTGQESYYGTKGLRKIKLERPKGRPDINWHFQYAPGNNNGTNVEDGQIPEIIFCAKHPY